MSVHDLLSAEAAAQPAGAHGLIALDWLNGNRSVLVDHHLSGLVAGLTLATRAPDIYRALIESTAFGTRVIIDAFEGAGVSVGELVIAGGLTKNELISTIDAQKNLLALDEAKRALAQLQQDIQSHSASNQAALALTEEKRHKARLAMEQAEQNIKNMHITSPIDGLVVIHGNRDSTGGFFMYGMTLPDYHVGDQVNPGSSIAEVIDISHLEVSAQVTETDHTNLKAGQSVEVKIDALPGESFSGKVQTVGGATSHEFWDENAQHKFDVTIQLDKTDARLRPGFATSRSTGNGNQVLLSAAVVCARS